MHFYKVGEQVLPSVTTLVHLVTFDDGLLYWANHMGFKHKNINTLKKESAAFGTLAHSHLRAFVDDSAPEPLPANNPYEGKRLFHTLQNFDKLMNGVKYKTITTEQTFKSTNLGYAGTVDWVATFNKDYVVLSDFKTSKQVNTSMHIQLGGYFGLLEEAQIHVDYAQIIIANENISRIHKLNRKELKNYHKLFMNLVGLYQDYTLINGPMWKPEDLIEDTE